MSYTSVFGGEPMLPADVSYRAITTSTSLTLVWPTEGQSTNNYVAKFNDVTTTLGGVVLTLPDATLASTGTTCIFNNVGSTSFQVNGATGAVVATIAPSTCWVIYLADNTTTAGVWRFFQYGATTSSATASALAGSGLKAITTTLNQNMPVFSFSSTYSTGSPDRAYVLMWTGSGTGTLNLDAPGTVGSDWFVHVRNSGGGALTIDPAGSVNIDGAATLILNPGNSCIIFTDGTAYYTIGLGIAATASQTFQTVAVGGTGDYTLSASEQNKVLYKFTGTLTGNRNIIVPATVQQYWVDNSTTGAFTFTVKTAAGSGVAVATGTRAVLYCDGTNVVDADTGGVATPIAIVDGGTGATTASAARTNLGATTVGNSLFTAADATAARTAISAVATGATITTAGLFSMATARLLGRSTAGSGDIEAITVGSGLLLSGGTLSSTAGGGSVTSVQVSGGTTGLTFSGGPITGAGTITMAGTLGTANGGTGTTSATGSGANVLATSPTLTSATLSGTGTTITVWDTLFTLQDNSDNTKQARFELSGITTGTTRTYTLPNSSGQLLIGGTTVTGSGGLTGGGDISTNQVISVATNGITNAMLAQVATATFKGRTTAGTGNVEDLTATQATALLNTFTTSLKGLAPSSGGGTTNYLRADGTWAAPPGTTNQTITLSGDVSGSGTTAITATIGNDAVTYAKMQNISATQRVLGRNTAGAGDTEEVTASQVLDWLDSTRGTILYRGASAWAGLDPNTAGFVLRDNGVGADPSWVGGITLLASGSASGATTVDITLAAGYTSYILRIEGIYNSVTTSTVNIRISTDGGTTYYSNSGAYAWSIVYTNVSNFLGSYDSSIGGTTTIYGAAGNIDNVAAQIAVFEYNIFKGDASPGNQPSILMQGVYRVGGGGGAIAQFTGAGYLGAVGPATNIRLLPGSGTMTITRYRLYGVI